MTLMITLLLVYVLQGYLEGKADKIAFSYQYLQHHWKNKYKKNPENGNLYKTIPENIPWYYFKLYTPSYVEKFPFSTTILVFLTDDWHLLNWVRYRLHDVTLTFVISSITGKILTSYAVLLLIIFPIIRGILKQTQVKH